MSSESPNVRGSRLTARSVETAAAHILSLVTETLECSPEGLSLLLGNTFCLLQMGEMNLNGFIKIGYIPRCPCVFHSYTPRNPTATGRRGGSSPCRSLGPTARPERTVVASSGSGLFQGTLNSRRRYRVRLLVEHGQDTGPFTKLSIRHESHWDKEHWKMRSEYDPYKGLTARRWRRGFRWRGEGDPEER